MNELLKVVLSLSLSGTLLILLLFDPLAFPASFLIQRAVEQTMAVLYLACGDCSFAFSICAGNKFDGKTFSRD